MEDFKVCVAKAPPAPKELLGIKEENDAKKTIFSSIVENFTSQVSEKVKE